MPSRVLADAPASAAYALVMSAERASLVVGRLPSGRRTPSPPLKGLSPRRGSPAKGTDLLPLASALEVRSGVEVDRVASQADPTARTLAGGPADPRVVLLRLHEAVRAAGLPSE